MVKRVSFKNQSNISSCDALADRWDNLASIKAMVSFPGLSLSRSWYFFTSVMMIGYQSKYTCFGQLLAGGKPMQAILRALKITFIYLALFFIQFTCLLTTLILFFNASSPKKKFSPKISFAFFFGRKCSFQHLQFSSAAGIFFNLEKIPPFSNSLLFVKVQTWFWINIGHFCATRVISLFISLNREKTAACIRNIRCIFLASLRTGLGKGKSTMTALRCTILIKKIVSSAHTESCTIFMSYLFFSLIWLKKLTYLYIPSSNVMKLQHSLEDLRPHEHKSLTLTKLGYCNLPRTCRSFQEAWHITQHWRIPSSTT